MELIGIKNIEKADPRTLRIVWHDNKEQLYDVVALRKACHCALCRDEWSHQQTDLVSQIDDTVRPERITNVGQYALKIDFSDGHSTGIYTFRRLRDEL